MKTVGIIGGSGFIGSYITKRFLAVVVNDVFDSDKNAACGQCVVGFLHQFYFRLFVPVVQDISHRDDVRFRQFVIEKIAAERFDAVCQAEFLYGFIGNRFDLRQIETRAGHMRLMTCN